MNRNLLLLVCALLLSFQGLFANWGQVNLREVDNPEPLGEFSSLRIPLKRAGNLFLIEAEIDSMRGQFILDLGSPYLVLNSTYFRNYEIDSNYFAGTVTNEVDFVRRTKVEKLEIGDLRYEGLKADVADLADIENRRGVKILGLLGVCLFKQFLFDLDLEARQLTLHRKPSSFEPAGGLLFRLPMQVEGDVCMVKGKVGGKNLRFSLDTGAETNILNNGLPERVFAGMEVLQTARVQGASGGEVEVLLARIKEVELKGFVLKEMRTLVLNLEGMSRAYGSRIDGMLGYPFFRQGRVLIDFEAKQISMYQAQGG